MTPEQEQRLPAYAREELRGLRREVERARAQADGVLAKARSRIVVNPHHDDQCDGYLEPRSTVRYAIGGQTGDIWHGFIDIEDAYDGSSHMGVQVRGAGPVYIEPQVSNVVIVRLR